MNASGAIFALQGKEAANGLAEAAADKASSAAVAVKEKAASAAMAVESTLAKLRDHYGAARGFPMSPEPPATSDAAKNSGPSTSASSGTGSSSGGGGAAPVAKSGASSGTPPGSPPVAARDASSSAGTSWEGFRNVSGLIATKREVGRTTLDFFSVALRVRSTSAQLMRFPDTLSSPRYSGAQASFKREGQRQGHGAPRVPGKERART